MLYHIQQVDEGYQIFRQTTVQEYPPESVSAPLEGEKIYASDVEALTRLNELKRGVKQRLGRVVEITIQCKNTERELAIQAKCAQLVEPLQNMLEFLDFSAAPAPTGEQQYAVRFLMRLLEPLAHTEADQPLRGLLRQFLELEGTIKAGYSFWIVEVAD